MPWYTAWWADNYSKIKVAQYPLKIHFYFLDYLGIVGMDFERILSHLYFWVILSPSCCAQADLAHALISCISQLCLPFCVDRGLWIMLLSSWSWYSEYITDTFIKIGITFVRKMNAKPNRNRFTPSACSSGDNSDNLIGGKRDHKFHA